MHQPPDLPRASRYEPRRWVGSGAEATVWLARDRVRDCDVALRATRDAARMFELRAGLRHPCLCQALDLIETAAGPWLVEDFVAGVDLQAAPPRGVEQVMRVARCLLHALAYLHEHDVVHRDIKPENIVWQPVTGGSIPVLVDFGFASRDSEDRRSGSLGTVAPEVLTGTADPRAADLFAVGATLLSAILGVAPQAEWSLDASTLQPLLENAPAPLRPVLAGLCSPRARGRFESAAAALAALPNGAVWTPPDAWPWVGTNDRAATGATLPPAVRVCCVVGMRGSGRSATAARLVVELRQRGGAPPLVLSDVTSEDAEAFARVAAAARADGGPRSIITTASRGVAGRLRAVLGDSAVLELEPPAFDEAAIDCLRRWLPLAKGDAAATVVARSDGHAMSAIDLLQPSPQPVGAAGAAELYLAVRGGRIRPGELSDGREPGEPAFAAAVEAGTVHRLRDGTFESRSLEADARALRAADRERLLDLHAIARDRVAPDARAFHAAALGEAAGPALDTLARRVRGGDVAAAEARLEHLRGLLGARELVATRAAFAALGRALIKASRVDLVEAILAEAGDDLPPEVLALRAFTCSERGDPAAAVRFARTAIEACPTLPASAFLDLARALQLTGRPSESLEVLRAGRDRAADDGERLELMQLESVVLFRLGRSADAIATAERAIENLGRGDRPELRLSMMQNLGMMLRHAGELERAAALLDTARQELLGLGDVRAAAIAATNLGIVLQDTGDLTRAQEVRREAFEQAEVAGLAQPREVARAGLGISLLLRGAWPAAAKILERAAAELREQGLDREARVARIHMLGARYPLDEAAASPGLNASLHDAIDAGLWGVAAVAWRTLLEHGVDAKLAPGEARHVLRAADRMNRELLRVELWRRRPDNPRVARVLDHLARTGLARPALSALEARLETGTDGASTRRRLAAVLRAARGYSAPLDRIRISIRALTVSRSPALHARSILHWLVELETSWPLPAEEPMVQTWNDHVSRLRECASRIAAGQSQRRDWRYEPFLRVNRMLLEEDYDDAVRERAILEEAMRITSAYRGMLMIRGKTLSLVRETGGGFASKAFDFSRSFVDDVIESGVGRATVNALEDPEWRHAASVLDFHLSSIACVPIRDGTETLGALYLDNPFEEGRFEDDAVEVLDAFATQISIGLGAARRRGEIAQLNAALMGQLAERTEALERAELELERVTDKGRVVYQSEVMAGVMKTVRRLAATDLPVHIRGETGTGKELVARKLHELSQCRHGPFISENCSALSGQLLESELFGHVAGAFTGAVRDKRGLLRMAHGGTLFLDEIGDMPVDLQSRLLRVIEEGRVRPVGGDSYESVDVRLVTATHRDLEAMVRDKEFREDLFYRVVVATVELPALRDRGVDVRLLAKHFLRRYGSPGMSWSDAALDAFDRHAWPGNVRELENAVRNATALAQHSVLEPSDLAFAQPLQAVRTGPLPTTDLKQLERLALAQALAAANGNRTETARRVGMSRTSVISKIREYGLEHRDGGAR